jgi:hypothetical protein
MEMYKGPDILKGRSDKFYLKGSKEASQRRCPLNWAVKRNSEKQF